MDRRVVAGIVGMALAGAAQAGQAQVGPDPSGLPPVGLSPIPSLGDTINGSSRFPGTSTPSRSALPTDPRDSGPEAAVPASPIPPAPFSLTPEPPLHQAIRSGYRPGPFSSLFRGNRPRASQPQPTTARPVAAPTRLSATRSAAASAMTPRPDPSAIRRCPRSSPTPPPVLTQGRPAPFADQRPEAARRVRPDHPDQHPPAGPDGGGTTLLRPPSILDPEEPELSSRGATGTRPGAETPTASKATDLPMPPLGQAPPPIAPEPPKEADPSPLIPPPELPPSTAAPVLPPASDPAVRRVVDEITAIKLLPDPPKQLPFATLRAAAVGDEVITIEELNEVVGQRMEEMKGSGPMSAEEKRQVVNMIASQALDHMIDQAVILHEASAS